MANRFMKEIEKENKANEQAIIDAKAAEIREANKKLIEETTPNTIIETVRDVKNGDYHTVRTEEGKPVDIGGNCKSKIVNINGRQCYVCGSTEAELKQDIDYIRLALARGDMTLPQFCGCLMSGRYITKVVYICGEPALTWGHTEEERAEDEIKARICHAKLRNGSRWDVLTAEELIEAGLKPTKEFEKNGTRYIYFADQSCARTYNGTENIMFIRRKDMPDVPWFTMAIDNSGNIEQIHLYKNGNLSIEDQAKAYINSNIPSYSKTVDVMKSLKKWAKEKGINQNTLSMTYGALCARG